MTMTPRRRVPGTGGRRTVGGAKADHARANHTRTGHTGATDDARAIDERYGLEPVFEPGDHRESDLDPGGSGTEPYTVECPYCGESFETLLDLSAGSASYIEDCRVCCQPIEFEVDTDADGCLSKLTARRGD